ncbi:LPS export ABC transporter periplasmic protein LptC [Roseomonas sp. OT10]|uniref:LPS export ABC transporter periplasmic protein LptC n=1 Tax=Roseomonas cutis TaxID=2897332 RepID=UPI001E330A6B|nr:LPS export ABC transporter periplasmic protein LptC [Roseomonas sp. OT10]UFN47391.1 LPS export ABC transporter periplasmic protein LptC [Roseomonas sp. OT10]
MSGTADPVPFPGRGPAAGALPEPSRVRRRYSRGAMLRRRWLIRGVKWLLPLAALALLSAIALWPEFDRAEDRARLSFRRVTRDVAGSARVVSPRYQGIDEQGRPYNVTAATATQAVADSPIALEQPRADVLMSDGAWVLLESDRGVYDKAAARLDLEGNVTLWHDNGSTLRTEAAQIRIDQGRAEGDRPVAAQGPFGTLTADGFRLEDRGKVVVFTGNAHAMLEGSR